MGIITREAHESDVAAIAELFDLYRQFYEQLPNIELAQAFIAERLAKADQSLSPSPLNHTHNAYRR